MKVQERNVVTLRPLDRYLENAESANRFAARGDSLLDGAACVEVGVGTRACDTQLFESASFDGDRVH